MFWLDSGLAGSSWLEAAFLHQAPCLYLLGVLCMRDEQDCHQGSVSFMVLVSQSQ